MSIFQKMNLIAQPFVAGVFAMAAFRSILADESGLTVGVYIAVSSGFMVASAFTVAAANDLIKNQGTSL